MQEMVHKLILHRPSPEAKTRGERVRVAWIYQLLHVCTVNSLNNLGNVANWATEGGGR